MKHLYTALALTASVAFGAHAEGYRSVAIHLNDGSKTEIRLSDDLKATFTSDQLVVHSTDKTVSVAKNRIQSFTFSEEEPLGVADPEAASAAPRITGSTMTFDGLAEGTSIAVYAVSGALLHSAVASGSYSIDLSGLPAGVCIVKVNEVSYKISTNR